MLRPGVETIEPYYQSYTALTNFNHIKDIGLRKGSKNPHKQKGFRMSMHSYVSWLNKGLN